MSYDLLSKLCGVCRYLVVTQELIGTPAGKIALEAWYAEKRVLMRLEKPSPEVVQERCRAYFKWRFREAVEALSSDSAGLAEVLIELLALIVGSEEIIGWEPVSLEEARARIGRSFRP